MTTMIHEMMALLRHSDKAQLNQFMARNPKADCAETLVHLLDTQRVSLSELKDILHLLTPDSRAELFSYLPLTLQVEIAQSMAMAELAAMAHQMAPDERVDLLALLPQDIQQQALRLMNAADRENIEILSAYPQGTIGAIMTTDFATLTRDLTVEEALAHLKLCAHESETIYQAYVLDDEQGLLGIVSLRELVLAEPSIKVVSIMTKVMIFVRANDEEALAAQAISKYDLLALPVLDCRNQLVGIVTYDDAMDVAEEQADRSFHKTAAVNFTGSLKDASIGLMYRKRVFWLVLLVFGNLFSGAGIAYFEDTIQTYVALVFFLPLLIDSGGNAGSQSATLMVRALATGEVVAKDWAKMVGKELAISALLGATMAAAVSLLGFWRSGGDIALVVALTMQIVVIIGSVVGMLLPFVLNKMNLDPASASAPLITTIADSIGVIVYFSVATMVLEFPPVV